MKKAFKFVFKAILWIVVFVVAVVLTLPLWIGPVAKTVAGNVVPGITGTPFRMGDFAFNFYTGRVRVGDMTLGNPSGYSPKEAFTLGELKVDMQVSSALSDTIVVDEVLVSDVFVSYVSKDGVNNFDAIMQNVKKGSEGESAEGDAVTPGEGEGERTPGDLQMPEAKPSEEPAKQKKVIIEHLVIDGVRVQWGFVPLALPTKIELCGIGRDTGGADWATVANEVINAVMAQLNQLGKGLKDLGNALKDVGIDGADKIAESVKAVDLQGVAESTKTGIGSVADGAGGAISSTTESAGKAISSLAEGAGGAISSAADGAGKAIGTTADAIKDAGGALKGIFKKK